MRDAKLKLPITSVNIYIFGQHSAASVTGHWHYDMCPNILNVSKHLCPTSCKLVHHHALFYINYHTSSCKSSGQNPALAALARLNTK